MVRFENVGGVNINVDRIKTFWHTRDEEKNNVIHVELDSGEIFNELDNHNITEEFITGDDFIVQVIPCIKPLYVRYKEKDKEIWEEPIYYLGLCASGYVRPLEACGRENLTFADDVSNYLGLYSETLEEEKNDR